MKRDFPAFLLYLFGFLLLWEWLRPVGQLTDTSHISTFVVFIFISFLMSFFNLKRLWQFIIKGFFILFTINQFHYHVSFFHFSWMKSFILHLKMSILLAFDRNWNDLSSDFRTLLFFILLWIMTYLIQYWLLKRMRIFIFFFMTLIYITVLDTFTDYDAKVAIVRTVITGFAVMGLLTFYRITKREHIDQESSYFRKWVIPLCGMIALSVFVGVITPKAAPIWPDPVPYLKGENKKTDASARTGKGFGPARIGYGTNDTKLGGPFIADKGRVFLYEAASRNYWKVETKDIYTGKGWIPSGSTPVEFMQGDLVPISSIPAAVTTTKDTAKVMLSKDAPYIGYPQGLQKIISVNPIQERAVFDIDTNKEKIVSRSTVSGYTVEFVIPKYNNKDLTKVSGPDLSVMSQQDYARYTQLPKGLPARIKQLTEKITANETNWFDKAKAVERYFGNSDFTYDQKNVPYPSDAQDYVDQFLFESKRGYCDNFSSSMAVMLRTIGIPTRWVKGFTGGDFLQYGKDHSKPLYEVTNNNAHAWVEVFIPTQGWVPFEPTKGFSNPIVINYPASSTSSNSQQPALAPLKKPQVDPRERTAEKEVKSTTAIEDKSLWSRTKTMFKNNWKSAVLYLIILAAVIYYLYRIRGKWVPYVLLLIYRFKKKDENLGKAYLELLTQLERYGLKRKKNQTLRNYARYVDSFFSTSEMTRLTELYEQYIYHQKLHKGSWKKSRELWENLIKKTIA